jgi:dihydrodipicolinate synthase/N-acetylneuraminate lyase
MRAGGAGVISGRSSAYPEVYAALRRDPGVQEQLDRIVALGASIGRIKHALHVRGLAGSPAGRMTIDPPEEELAAAIAAEVAGLLAGAAGASGASGASGVAAPSYTGTA